mgnify:CR=1 FL=1
MTIDKHIGADEYWDLQHLGLIDKQGQRVPHEVQYEFMLGYNEEPGQKKSKIVYVDIPIDALAASIAAVI